MAEQETAEAVADRAVTDHAGGMLARALLASPLVSAVRAVGCSPLPDGGMSYGLAVTLDSGTELLIADVQAVG